MQQMNHEETRGEWQNSYGGYASDAHENDHDLPGQKLEGENDEEFADLLARKIKHELQPEKASLLNQRLLLGIVSLCALVCLFGLLVLALLMGLSSGSAGGLSFAFFMACGAIMAINGYFNWASISTNKKDDKKAGKGE